MKISFIQRLSLTLIFFVGFTLSQTPNIIINEFLTSNAHINYDPDYKNYSDWFELYNNENYPINLNGYYLTDDLTNPTKWGITNDITIEANDYLVFWADNEDDWIHTDFKLNVDGEQIGIYTSDGSIVDTVTYKSQQADVSYGRNTNNENEWLYYSNPTPGTINNTIGYTEIVNCSLPMFSVNSGFYANDISLKITVDQDSEIRYTLDGSEPDENSEKYTTPINISDRTGDPNYFSEIPTNINPWSLIHSWTPPLGEVRKATIVRAKVFATGKVPSKIVTSTYFVGQELKNAYSTIPVISLVTDEKHFFSDTAGIYVPGQTNGNYEQDWTRPVEIQFFDENGNLEISQEVDIRIQGSSSRHMPQKALHVIARSKYGKSTIDYPFFKNTKSKANKLTSFKRFMIRAWGYPTWGTGMINDALSQTSYAESSLDIQDYRPTIVFINGEYWGLQEIREANKNPYYFEEHYGIEKDNPGVDILVGGANQYYIDEGDDVHWKNMMNFIFNNDLSVTQNYKYIKTQMDVHNFVDYIGHCIYFGKTDWPVQNEAFWRSKTEDGRWKWIQYDMDMCLSSLNYNMIDHVINGGTNHEPHPILVHLIKNQQFKIKFINWYLDRINSDFKSEILHKNYNKILNDIYPYLDEHQNRWVLSKSNFGTFTAFIRDFISKRPSGMQSLLKSYFDLGDLNTVILGLKEGGIVKINSLQIDEDTPGYMENKKEWLGKYFEDVPILLTAIPNEGYTFDHWEGPVDSQSDSIGFYLDKNMWLAAVFFPTEKVDSLFINEILADNESINTDSTGKYDDWIELYNAGSDTINLTGLYLTDDFTNPLKWKIPVVDSISFNILPNEYKIIWCDNDPEEGQDHLGFSLSKMGEMIGITQITGNDTVFIDSVSFSEQLPNISYGRFPDATNKWEFMLLPTPGSSNVFKPISYDQLNSPQLFQNYPNPFNVKTSIPFYLSDINDVTIDIYNVEGKLVRSLIDKQKEIGYSKFLWDGRDSDGNSVSSGVYFYRMQTDDFNQVKKMLFMK